MTRLLLPSVHELSPPQLAHINDGGVRRHILGEMRSRNSAQAIVDEYYGKDPPGQGPPLATTRPQGVTDAVANPSSPAVEPGEQFPGQH